MPRGDLVQSVGKALDLLELLGDAGELRLADLCERTGPERPHAHPLVRTPAAPGCGSVSSSSSTSGWASTEDTPAPSRWSMCRCCECPAPSASGVASTSLAP